MHSPVAGLSAGIVWSRILNPFEPVSSPKVGGCFLAPSGLDATVLKVRWTRSRRRSIDGHLVRHNHRESCEESAVEQWSG